MQNLRGGKEVHISARVQNRPYGSTVRLKNKLSTPQTPRPSITISTYPALVTTTEGYRDCGTEPWMASEVGRSDGPKEKLAPYVLTAADVGGYSAASSTKGFQQGAVLEPLGLDKTLSSTPTSSLSLTGNLDTYQFVKQDSSERNAPIDNSD